MFRWTLPGVMLLALIILPGLLEASDPKRIASLCDILHPSDLTVEWKCRRLHKGEALETLFGKFWADVARFNRIDRRHAHGGVALKVPKRLEDITGFTPLPRVFPPTELEQKFILVDLSEQFLGAYEYGILRFSMPITTGKAGHETPRGQFQITAAHRRHRSSLYTIEGMDIPYPMPHALFFHIDRDGMAFWMHGRDLPGFPASHGCIGLYAESMQQQYYGVPQDPVLEDARRLYQWVISDGPDDGSLLSVKHGPTVLIRGQAPAVKLRQSAEGKESFKSCA